VAIIGSLLTMLMAGRLLGMVLARNGAAGHPDHFSDIPVYFFCFWDIRDFQRRGTLAPRQLGTPDLFDLSRRDGFRVRVHPGICMVSFAFAAHCSAAGCQLSGRFSGVDLRSSHRRRRLLLNRKDIARQFAPEVMLMEDGVTPVAAKPRCPLPIAILAWSQLLSACGIRCFFCFLLPVSIPAVFSGHAIYGRSAGIIYALLSITSALCAIGLLLLKNGVIPLLIGYHVFYSASALGGLLNPNTWTVMWPSLWYSLA
jgi:hypothetical protein